ncbi:hypothetical protein [Phenylobacterium sp.]|uniref:hypothetical protein n=1 Tax=Phenylobacterium sp. TaxID=1871053 RepID=UPI0035633310
MLTLAARFGVPASALRQACRDADIPLPGPGHWTRLRAGKPVVQAALPPRGPAMAQQVTITPYGLSSLEERKAELAEALPDPPIFDEPIEAVRARTLARVNPVKALASLDRACADVRRLLAADDQRRADKAAHRGSPDWEGPRLDSPFERRRLRLLNSLTFAFAKVGAKLELRGPTGRDLAVRIGTRRLTLTLDAPGAQPTFQGEWTTRPGPAGPLALRIVGGSDTDEGTNAWIDRDDAPLEAQLADVVVSMLVVAEVRHRAAEVAGHAHRIAWRAQIAADLVKRQADAERRRDEREIMKVKARRKRLFGQARDWRKARNIRGFVAEVLTEVGGKPDDAGVLAEWSAWALAEADALDPVAGDALEPWRPQDEDDIERPCGCGFRCERPCACGAQRACVCDCADEPNQDNEFWLRLPDSDGEP